MGKPVLDLKTKLKIIEEVEKGGVRKGNIAFKYKIPQSTLSTILKQKNKIREVLEKKGFASKRKRMRNGAWPKLEKALLLWLQTARNNNYPVNGALLKEKAENLSLRLGMNNFKISNGWLTRFKKRHGLSFRSICGEAAGVNVTEVDTWKNETLPALLKEYSANDIYNADETGLFWKQLPSKSLVLAGDTCHGGKQSKVRITVLVCANMSGTDKCKLLVVGNAKKPRCFRGIQTLPVQYYANKKAWITSEIFIQWISKLDNRFKAEKLKVLLIVDNCSAHPKVQDLQAIKLVFFPPNATSILQPMDQGIIQQIKLQYRKSIMQRLFLCMENNKQYELNIFKAIHTVSFAWSLVPEATIRNCFKHAGFVKEDLPIPDVPNDGDAGADELVVELQKKGVVDTHFSFKAYVDMDTQVNTCPSLSEADLVDAVLLDNSEAEDDDDEDDTPEIQPNLSDVSKSIETLRMFVSMHAECAQYFKHLQEVEKLFLCKMSKLLKQKQITDFFKKV